MSALDTFLKEIQENPLFPSLLEHLKHNRPAVPVFDPIKQNEEDWKMKSGMRQGYDLCLSIFKIRGI